MFKNLKLKIKNSHCIRLCKKLLIRLIRWVNYVGSGLSMRLVKWTRKAPQPIHPKHLINESPEWLIYFKTSDNVLDIGCHNGQRDFKLAPHVSHITAFDYDERQLALARKWQKEKNIPNIDFRRISAEDILPFPDNSFDAILFLDVIEHLNNRDLIMSECFRVLKKGGRMVLAAPNSETPWKQFQKSAGVNYYSDSDHKIEYTKKELSDAHARAGFVVEEIHPVVYDTPWNGVIDFIGGIHLGLYKKLSERKKKRALTQPDASIDFMVISSKEKLE